MAPFDDPRPERETAAGYRNDMHTRKDLEGVVPLAAPAWTLSLNLTSRSIWERVVPGGNCSVVDSDLALRKGSQTATLTPQFLQQAFFESFSFQRA